MDRRMRAAATAAGAATVGAVAYAWHDHRARLRSTRRAGFVRVSCDRTGASEGLDRLLAAAGRAGLDRADSRRLARVTLVTFMWCLPPVERVRFLAALPADVRRLAAWPPRRTWERREIHTGDQLVSVVAERGELAGTVQAGLAAKALLAVLHDLAGSEAGAVAAALPPGLRPIWTGQAATGPSGFSVDRRVFRETPVRGEWGWVQAPVAPTSAPVTR
jgi:uncharacterized protein (DUF2267 family)